MARRAGAAIAAAGFFVLAAGVPAAGAAPVLGEAHPIPAAGERGGRVVTGDFDGDTRQDIAVADIKTSTVRVLYGDGNGNFPAVTELGPFPGIVGNLVSGNFDGNAPTDLAFSSGLPPEVRILRGQPSRTFSSSVPVALPSSRFRLASADLNSDGLTDLVAGSTSVTVLLASGEGAFAAPQTYPVRGTFTTFGDFNGDGSRDIAMCGTTSSLQLMLNDGQGHFAAVWSVPVGGGPGAIARTAAAGDLSGDGLADLVVTRSWGDLEERVVFLNEGNGAFEERPVSGGTAYIYGTNSDDILVDMNGDGILDLVGGSGTYQFGGGVFLEYRPGVGNGNWGQVEAVRIPVGQGGAALAVARFNSDALPDVVASSGPDGSFLFRNMLAPAGSSISAVQKTRIASNGEGFQELFYNYNTRQLTVSPYSSSTGTVAHEEPLGQWTGVFHYDYSAGRFTQAVYSNRQLLPETGKSVGQ